MTRSTPFGEHLKREREMRGVSLEEISAATRISVRFLAALENEQWERLPGGVFNRGFIRAVAHFLGLEEEGLIAEYALETRDEPQVAVWADKAPQPRFAWAGLMLIVLFLIALSAGGWYTYRRFGSTIEQWCKEHPLLKELEARLRRAPLASAADDGATAAAAKPVAPKLPATTFPVGATGPPGAPTSPSPAAGGLPAAPAPLELKIEAGKTSEVKVVADGKTVFAGKLSALQTLSFQALDTFFVSSRDATAVVLELNGQTLPPLGPPGQPGSIRLSHKDLKLASGGQN